MNNTITNNGSYHLISNSPCIDVGDPISPKDADSSRIDIGCYFLGNTQTKVVQPQNPAPSNFRLFQNYPNPFNALTVFSYYLDKSDFVNLKLYDLKGKEVEILVSENQQKREHHLKYNARSLPIGLYYYVLQVGDNTKSDNSC